MHIENRMRRSGVAAIGGHACALLFVTLRRLRNGQQLLRLRRNPTSPTDAPGLSAFAPESIALLRTPSRFFLYTRTRAYIGGPYRDNFRTMLSVRGEKENEVPRSVGESDDQTGRTEGCLPLSEDIMISG